MAARFRILAPDLRGHGRSDYEPPWDLATHVGDLAETAGALGIERAVWIGHSFGGRLVLELTAQSPERVERAVLLDPAVWVPPPVALARAEEQRTDTSFGSVEEALEARIASSGLRHTPRELLEEEMADHLERGPDGRLRYRYCASAVVAAFGELAKAPPLAELRAPTLLVRGAESDVVPDLAVDFSRSTYGPLLEVSTVPGGHNVLWDAFSETADAIEAFLA